VLAHRVRQGEEAAVGEDGALGQSGSESGWSAAQAGRPAPRAGSPSASVPSTRITRRRPGSWWRTAATVSQNSSSTKIRAAPESRRMWSTSVGVSRQLTGTRTAPALAQASITT
jgi:hypothetical protein